MKKIIGNTAFILGFVIAAALLVFALSLIFGFGLQAEYREFLVNKILKR